MDKITKEIIDIYNQYEEVINDLYNYNNIDCETRKELLFNLRLETINSIKRECIDEDYITYFDNLICQFIIERLQNIEELKDYVEQIKNCESILKVELRDLVDIYF